MAPSVASVVVRKEKKILKNTRRENSRTAKLDDDDGFRYKNLAININNFEHDNHHYFVLLIRRKASSSAPFWLYLFLFHSPLWSRDLRDDLLLLLLQPLRRRHRVG